MTLAEKQERLNEYCGNTSCHNCVLNNAEHWSNPCEVTNCPEFVVSPESDLDKALSLIESVAETVADDPVNHPSHYTDGKIEVIDFIEDKKLGFCLGNAVKYIARAGKKDPSKEVEDLKKAAWYVARRIQEIEEGLA